MTSSESRKLAGPVVDATRSPFCALRPVAVDAVRLTDAFWAPRLRANRELTIPSQLAHCKATGRIDNFRRAAGKIGGEFQGIYFNDSDVYKWIEAASWSLATDPDPALERDLDEVIAEVAAAQQPDGYLNTYFMFDLASERFTNLKDKHEIYCAGHLFQAAVAHHRATGKATLLETARRLADHLFDVFGPGGRVGACGHEEGEMGLVELYRVTGDRRYLELAERMIAARGREPRVLGGSPYHQDHLPFVEQTEMVGHAVRHLYLCCGAADVAAETGELALTSALDALWRNFTQKKMYVTGGAGSRWEGEAFGADYELPNDRAYTETCAAIGSVMWSWRMLHLTGRPEFADAMETALYNAVLPGLSLDGARYFYQNPLADRGGHRRQEWFGCACCPPNVARMLGSLSGYVYSTSDDGVYVHLYAKSAANIALPGGDRIAVRQECDYPWDGDIVLQVESAPARECAIHLRIPSWADRRLVRLTVNDADASDALGGSRDAYCAIRRRWQAGNRIRLSLPMEVERVAAHPHVLNNHGRVALRRGPLIYCLEQADNPGCDVSDATLPATGEFAENRLRIGEHEVVALKLAGSALDLTPWQDKLYSADPAAREVQFRPAALTAIPYYAWANREPGPMAVWLPVRHDA